MRKSKFLMNICEATVVYKTRVKKADRENVGNSAQMRNILRALLEPYMETREAFYVMYLNQAHDVVAVERISEGGMCATIVDQRMIFRTAVKIGGVTRIAMCHNHPSGNLTPSEADNRLTRKIAEGGKLLDVTLLDHIIFTQDGYYSYADNGAL
jgi:DNA repair protein RadC